MRRWKRRTRGRDGMSAIGSKAAEMDLLTVKNSLIVSLLALLLANALLTVKSSPPKGK